jgi:CHAT domain-containing protein/cytochrome c-type biogenesis protein CcmH/NrfG
LVPLTGIEEIEKKMLTGEAYFERFLAEEEDLIEDYLDGHLSPEECAAFENHFLISEERREKTDTVRLLRKYTLEKKPANEKEEREAAEKRKRANRRTYWSLLPIAAAILVIILVGGYIFSKIDLFNPPQQRAMAFLNKAFKEGRPLEGRISDFDYAPYNSVRDGEVPALDIDFDRAKSAARGQMDDEPTPENRHQLARVYLSAREFDNALKLLEEAHTAAPGNAEIISDIGVVYLEKSRSANGNERITLVAGAIDHFDQALAIDPELLPARFNKAIAMETYFPNRAKEMWQEYLRHDQASDWAAEARNHLEALNKESVKSFSTAEELESAFAIAYREGNDDRALEIASQNRELVGEKYLPQKLAADLVKKKKTENEKLALLKYLGEIEKRSVGDSYAADLAVYYEDVPEGQFPLLREAQEKIKEGFRLCLETNDFEQARLKFEAARDLFLKAGDVIEAETIGNHFIAYCYYNTDRHRLAYPLLQKVNDYCAAKNYEWFRLMNLDFLLGGRELLGYQSFTDNENDYEQGVADAMKMRDNYTTQKFLLALIRKNQFIGQEKHVFNYLDKLFQFSKEPNVSERQKIRIFDKAIPILANSRIQNFAKEVALESVAFTGPMSDPQFAIGSQINAGVVDMQAGNFDEAEAWLGSALKKAESLAGPVKPTTLARIYTQMARFKKMRGDLQRSAEYYDRSLRILEKLNTPVSLYETKKSRLLVYQQLGDEKKVEADIYSTLKLAENYREQIGEEQARNSFFDNEQDIYDVAIEHKMRTNQNEAAYDYAEISNSRSLLDMLNQGASVTIKNQEIKVLLNKSGNPSKIGEIRKMMPEGAQILQYSMLSGKVLLWIVTKEKLVVVSSDIDSRKLKAEVENYLNSIRAKEPDENISRRLYEKLVLPALPYLDKEKDICIIPDKILFHLPFSSLISREGKYLLEEFNLFYSPSANVFINLSGRAKNRTARENENILSIGNPTFDPQQFPRLRDLPDAEIEAREIVKNYPHSKILLRNEATKSAFLQDFKDFEVIHFAGHYTAQPDLPLLSKLIMARDPLSERDGFLTNADLIREKLPNTHLIVLSACQTGIEKYSDGEGLFGLSRTFLSLGVPLVVASQWKVDSGASAELMRSFHYFRRQKNLSTTNALRQAQLEMLRSENGRFRSAYFWAAFATFGGYAEY